MTPDKLIQFPLTDAPKPTAETIQQAHDLYCAMTGQTLTMRFDRERQWYDLLCEGYSMDDIRQVIAYLQRQIRERKRNVGCLKLSNLLQLDRFEEDFQISRVNLRPQLKATPMPKYLEGGGGKPVSEKALDILRRFKQTLRTIL